METSRESHELNSASGWARPLAGIFAALTCVMRVSALIPNFTPMGALSVFSGARLRLWQALALPMAVMVVTDLLIYALRGYTPFNLFVYVSLLVCVLLGRFLLSTWSPLRIGGIALVASLQFFLVTNFGVWLSARVPPEQIPGGDAVFSFNDPQYAYPMIRYAANAQGLLACYTTALPFYGPQLLADLLFTALFFGIAFGMARLNAGVRSPAGVAVPR